MLKGKRAPSSRGFTPGVGTSSPGQSRSLPPVWGLVSSFSFLQDIVLTPVASPRARFFQPPLLAPITFTEAPSSSVYQLTGPPARAQPACSPHLSQGCPLAQPSCSPQSPSHPCVYSCSPVTPPSAWPWCGPTHSSFEMQPACPFAPVTVSCTPLLWLWAGSSLLPPKAEVVLFISSSSLGSSAVSGRLYSKYL